MKKEFIDYMYELRSLIQQDIDRLVDILKSPQDGNCSGCGNESEAELRTRRSQIGSLNQTIEKYFKTHSKDL